MRNGYKKMQIEAHDLDNNDLLRAAGVKRIHKGWYTVTYNGVCLDASTILQYAHAKAKRNRHGEIDCDV